jgi:hypothetical protein
MHTVVVHARPGSALVPDWFAFMSIRAVARSSRYCTTPHLVCCTLQIQSYSSRSTFAGLPLGRLEVKVVRAAQTAKIAHCRHRWGRTRAWHAGAVRPQRSRPGHLRTPRRRFRAEASTNLRAPHDAQLQRCAALTASHRLAAAQASGRPARRGERCVCRTSGRGAPATLVSLHAPARETFAVRNRPRARLLGNRHAFPPLACRLDSAASAARSLVQPSRHRGDRAAVPTHVSR